MNLKEIIEEVADEIKSLINRNNKTSESYLSMNGYTLINSNGTNVTELSVYNNGTNLSEFCIQLFDINKELNTVKNRNVYAVLFRGSFDELNNWLDKSIIVNTELIVTLKVNVSHEYSMIETIKEEFGDDVSIKMNSINNNFEVENVIVENVTDCFPKKCANRISS